jgi:hypothetical protein
MGRCGQKGPCGLPEKEGFLIGPGITPPDATDPMYFSHVTSDLIEQCTIASKPNYRIIGRLEEGEQLIVLDLIIEPADSRQRFRCATLIDSGATGLFIDRVYATCIETQFHRLEAPATVRNVDGTEN